MLWKVPGPCKLETQAVGTRPEHRLHSHLVASTASPRPPPPAKNWAARRTDRQRWEVGSAGPLVARMARGLSRRARSLAGRLPLSCPEAPPPTWRRWAAGRLLPAAPARPAGRCRQHRGGAGAQAPADRCLPAPESLDLRFFAGWWALGLSPPQPQPHPPQAAWAKVWGYTGLRVGLGSALQGARRKWNCPGACSCVLVGWFSFNALWSCSPRTFPPRISLSCVTCPCSSSGPILGLPPYPTSGRHGDSRNRYVLGNGR